MFAGSEGAGWFSNVLPMWVCYSEAIRWFSEGKRSMEKVLHEVRIIETDDGFRIELKGDKERLREMLSHFPFMRQGGGMPSNFTMPGHGPHQPPGPGAHFFWKGRRGHGPRGPHGWMGFGPQHDVDVRFVWKDDAGEDEGPPPAAV